MNDALRPVPDTGAFFWRGGCVKKLSTTREGASVPALPEVGQRVGRLVGQSVGGWTDKGEQRMISRLVGACLSMTCLCMTVAGALSPSQAHDAALAPLRRAVEAAQTASPVVKTQSRRNSDVSTRRTSPDNTTTPAGQAQNNGEVLFGAQNVGFLVDRDVIPVGAEIGKFDRVRVRVLRNDIFITDLTAVYEDGETESLLTKAKIRRNRKTEWIPLQHDGFIKELRLVYNSRPSFKGTARVEVFGEYTDDWLGPGGEGRRYNNGWVLLGTDTAGSIGFDHVKIRVGDNEGGFKQLRVAVKDRDITMTKLAVVYADGETDDLQTKRIRVAAGKGFGPVELDEDDPIKEIRGTWRSRAFSTSKRKRAYATVQVWARR
jgi:hypothetical protein